MKDIFQGRRVGFYSSLQLGKSYHVWFSYGAHWFCPLMQRNSLNALNHTDVSAGTCPIQKFHSSYRRRWYVPASMGVARGGWSIVLRIGKVQRHLSFLGRGRMIWVYDGCLVARKTNTLKCLHCSQINVVVWGPLLIYSIIVSSINGTKKIKKVLNKLFQTLNFLWHFDLYWWCFHIHNVSSLRINRFICIWLYQIDIWTFSNIIFPIQSNRITIQNCNTMLKM